MSNYFTGVCRTTISSVPNGLIPRRTPALGALFALLGEGFHSGIFSMSKAFRIALAVFALAAASGAQANTINLGVMGPPALRIFGNDFSTAGDFNDEYTFSLLGSADAFGFALTFDGSIRRDIDIYSVSLWSNGTSLDTVLWSGGLVSFSFDDLNAGAYSMFVTGTVTGRNGGLLGGGLVGYGGTIVTTGSASPAVPTSVPEPGTIGLFGLGLLGLVNALRRKRAS
jgi:PEP-CTERM motif